MFVQNLEDVYKTGLKLNSWTNVGGLEQNCFSPLTCFISPYSKGFVKKIFSSGKLYLFLHNCSN